MKKIKILLSAIVFVFVSLIAFNSCNKNDNTPVITDLTSYLVAYSWDMSDANPITYVGVVTFDDKGVYTLTRDGGTSEIYSYVVDDAKSNVTVSNNTGEEEYHVTWDKNGTEMKWDGVTTNFMHLVYKVK